MERLMTAALRNRDSKESDRPGTAALRAELERRCLRCGHVASDRPRGCVGNRCGNCGHPYPLGDCSD